MSSATLSASRLSANKANAQKSTGPRTPQGKQKSSRNALKHGLTCKSSALLDSECPNAYYDFCREVEEDLSPKTATQSIVVERIAQLMWRLRRCPTAEAQLFKRINDARTQKLQEDYDYDQERYEEEMEQITNNQEQITSDQGQQTRDKPTPPQQPDLSPEPPEQTLARSFSRRQNEANPFLRLQRYESTLDRQLHKALQELRRLKKEYEKNPPKHREYDYTPSSYEEDEQQEQNEANSSSLATDNSQLATAQQNEANSSVTPDAQGTKNKGQGTKLHSQPPTPIIKMNTPSQSHIPQRATG